jgi:hypothetical protein
MRAAEASRRASFRATNNTLELAWKALNAGSWNDGVLQRGNARQNKRGAAHRPGLADAEVVGVSVLPYADVPCERAALLGKESAAARQRRELSTGSSCAGMRGGGGGAGLAYERRETRESDGGTGPSNRFPNKCLQPHRSSAVRLCANATAAKHTQLIAAGRRRASARTLNRVWSAR